MLSIDDPELERLLRAEASRTGETEGDVLRRALRSALYYGAGGAPAVLPQGERGPLSPADRRPVEERIAAIWAELPDEAWAAVSGRLAQTPEELDALVDRVRKIQDDVASLPVLDSRPPDEMLYDEQGLPK